MFTGISFVLAATAVWLADRGNEKDRKLYDVRPEDELILYRFQIRLTLQCMGTR
jgi:hypothetical protein